MSGSGSWLDEPKFAALVDCLVANEAPRLFAVVYDYGERTDATIAAWGMAFTDHAEVVSVDSRQRMSLRTPECAPQMFEFDDHIRARLVWFKLGTATPVENDAAA